MTLTIYQVFEGSRPQELASLSEDVVYIGREPPKGGIKIDSRAVSREHAVFIRISNLWFYKDLGSSNGSWLNGQHVSAGVPYLLRAKDTIQLADSVIKLLGDEDSDTDGACIAVFCRGDFLGIYPVPQVGKVLSIGGTQADLKLDVDFGDLPVVVIEKRSNFICAFPVDSGNKAMINDNQLTQLVQLKDRDSLSVSPYTLIVSIPNLNQLDQSNLDDATKVDELKETFSGWDEEEKPFSHKIFGQFKGSEIERQAGDDFEESERTIVSDMRPGGRFAESLEERPDKASIIEDKIVFILGFLMVLVILSLVLWWFLG